MAHSSVSSDSKFVTFNTANSDTDDGNKTFVINLENNEVTKFTSPIKYSSAKINSEDHTIILIGASKCEIKIDFNGNEIDNSYITQLFNKNEINGILTCFYNKPKEIKFDNSYYLKGFQLAIDENAKTVTFLGVDKIYREIGEYYDANNDIEKTIFYWEKAIKINPKVGILTRLKKIKLKK